jgi:hypothetical protein
MVVSSTGALEDHIAEWNREHSIPADVVEQEPWAMLRFASSGVGSRILP